MHHQQQEITTNNLILDHLFYQSIQSRLSFQKETDKKNVIESLIEDILQSSCLNDPIIEQRLNLCQLTNLTLGRTHHLTFSTPINTKPRQDTVRHPLFSFPCSPLYCRRHRKPRCCSSNNGGPGLAEAIPCFLKTSAYKLRAVLEGGDRIVAGQRVMGGGMPPRWYDLFLDLLTQAAIQAYMCDGKTGLETIYEIFSYGYIEDDDEEEDEEFIDEQEEDEQDIWQVKAADHHLLFPKTRTMYLFNLQVHKREKEFIDVKEGYTLEQHFKELADLYPLYLFERNMCDFIQMIVEDMDIPALDKSDVSSPIKSPQDLPDLHSIHLYTYPNDGSILIPDIPTIYRKRSAITASLDDHTANKRKRC